MTAVFEHRVGRRKTDVVGSLVAVPSPARVAGDSVVRPWGEGEKQMQAWLRSFESEADLRRALAWRRLLWVVGRSRPVAQTVAAWRLLVLADGLERDEIPVSLAPVRAGVTR